MIIATIRIIKAIPPKTIPTIAPVVSFLESLSSSSSVGFGDEVGETLDEGLNDGVFVIPIGCLKD